MVTVTRTITENTNGRRQNPESPTGWERRSGETRVIDAGLRLPKGRRADLRVPIWEPCEGPRTYVVGSPEEAAREGRGGTIRTVITGVEDDVYNLTAEEAETVLRGHVWNYNTGMSIYYGNTHVGDLETMQPHEGHAMAEKARRRVLALFDLDLALTNVGGVAPLK